MIKFEEHCGMLFSMLDKPTPLTPESQFPCVVQLIQDDTMLGKANKRVYYPRSLANKRICNELTDDGLFMDGSDAYRYEIIGYPVVKEGSEDALQARIEELENAAIVWHKYPEEKPIDGRYLFWDSDGNAPHVLPYNDLERQNCSNHPHYESRHTNS